MACNPCVSSSRRALKADGMAKKARKPFQPAFECHSDSSSRYFTNESCSRGAHNRKKRSQRNIRRKRAISRSRTNAGTTSISLPKKCIFNMHACIMLPAHTFTLPAAPHPLPKKREKETAQNEIRRNSHCITSCAV